MRSSIIASPLLAAILIGCSGTPATRPSIPLPEDTPKPEPKKPTIVKEDWAGTLALPRELVDIVVHFTNTDGAWSATLDVPSFNVTAVPLTRVNVGADGIAFTLEKPGGPQVSEQYALRRTGDTAEGVMFVAGQGFYAKAVKLKPGEAPRSVIGRPQVPKPPFPYTSREVEIPAPEDGTLAGTLTIPEGKGPFPAVLLISGSGQQDRDETIFGHKAFAVLADRLTRDGIAVLRTDDRGVGKTKGNPNSLETEFTDGRAAFEFLAKQPEVDPKRTGILGHSIGALIAPTVAARTGKVAFIVSLAGPGISGAELVPLQLELSMKGLVPDKVLEAAVKGQKRVAAAIVKGKEDEIKTALRETTIETAAAAGMPKPSDAELDAAIAAKMPEVTNPWVVAFFKTDPAVAWKKMRGPVLALVGDKDTQVPADINLAKLSAAVKSNGNRDITTEKRPGLNHLFQHATTGQIEEYGKIEETFDPATLDVVAKWVVAKTKKR